MGLSIKNAEVERMARELASRRGVSMTEAIRQSLKREVEREEIVRRAMRRSAQPSERFKAMMAIAQETAAMPRISNLSDDEILGYDELGVPELPREMR
jgi:antitoxin VapB